MFLYLINSGKNAGFLNDAIHLDYAGFSPVLHVLVADNGDEVAKVKVKKNMCSYFGWEEKEILAYALENTEKLFPPGLCPVEEILNRINNIKAENIKATDRILIAAV